MTALPPSAGAIVLGNGGDCVAAFVAAAGAQSGTGNYGSACGDTAVQPTGNNNTLFKVITGLDGLRDDPVDWSVMPGNGATDGSNTYGVFEIDGLTKVTFVINVADNNHNLGVTDAATQTGDIVLLPSTEDASIGDMVQFVATEDFLLYALNVTGNQRTNKFYSERSLNSFAGVDDFVHFLILQGDFGLGTEYLVIVEDQVTGCVTPPPGTGTCGNMDDDFNDAGILVQTVPEPGTLALLGAGLLALGVYRRRRDA